jgi:hypothetical protein
MIQRLYAEVAKDRLLYAAIAINALASFSFALGLGVGAFFRPLLYTPVWLIWMSGVAGLWLIWVGLRALFDEAPFAALKRQLATLIEPRTLAGLILCLALTIENGVLTSTKTMLPHAGGFLHDRTFADIDHAIHGVDPWLLLRWMDPYTGVLQLLYTPSWLFCFVALTFAATLSPRLAPLKSQYLWTMLICVVVLGQVSALAGISAGPLFYQEVTGDPRFAGLVQHDELFRHMTGSAVRVRDLLWHSFKSASPGLVSGISAFPSMHVSLATLFFLFARRIHPALGAAFGGYAMLILLSSVHLGWHYAVDGYVSILATAAIWAAVGWALRRRAVAPARIGALETA